MKTLSLTKEELCLISIALNEYQFNLDNYHLDEMKQVSTKIDTIYKEDQMRTLTLTQTQFDVLYGILKDTVNDIEEDVLYDTVTYEIYEKLIQMGGQS